MFGLHTLASTHPMSAWTPHMHIMYKKLCVLYCTVHYTPNCALYTAIYVPKGIFITVFISVAAVDGGGGSGGGGVVVVVVVVALVVTDVVVVFVVVVAVVAVVVVVA